MFNTKIDNNLYGAASIIIDKYPYEMKTKVEELLFKNQKIKINKKIKNALLSLKLDEPINRDNIIGKKPEEIEEDFKMWEKIAEEVKKIKKRIILW